MLNQADIQRHYWIMGKSPHASAYEALRQSFQEPDYDLEPLTGVIEGVKVWDRWDRYLFAWQVNPQHLLFYLRRPALDVAEHLHDLAVQHHPAERISQNSRKETKIELRSRQDADRLLAWLLPELPLAAGGRSGRRRRT